MSTFFSCFSNTFFKRYVFSWKGINQWNVFLKKLSSLKGLLKFILRRGFSEFKMNPMMILMACFSSCDSDKFFICRNTISTFREFLETMTRPSNKPISAFCQMPSFSCSLSLSFIQRIRKFAFSSSNLLIKLMDTALIMAERWYHCHLARPLEPRYFDTTWCKCFPFCSSIIWLKSFSTNISSSLGDRFSIILCWDSVIKLIISSIFWYTESVSLKVRLPISLCSCSNCIFSMGILIASSKVREFEFIWIMSESSSVRKVLSVEISDFLFNSFLPSSDVEILASIFTWGWWMLLSFGDSSFDPVLASSNNRTISSTKTEYPPILLNLFLSFFNVASGVCSIKSSQHS